MNQNKRINPYSPPKDIERVTETHTYTDKPYSHFDPTHDEISSNKVNRKMRTFNDLIVHQERKITLTKVRSMPPTQFNILDEVDQVHVRGTLELDNKNKLRITGNKSNKNLQNKQFNDLPPIVNRSKLYELNRTYNTNLDSKELVDQEHNLILTQKMSQADRLNRKGFSKYIDPATFESSLQSPGQINITPKPQNKSVASPFIYVQNCQSQIVPNVRFTTNPRESQLIQNPYRNVRFANNSQLNRSSIVFQQPNLIVRDSRVEKSNVNDANTRKVYQSELIDQKNEMGQKKYLPQRRSLLKISQLQNQECKEIQIERPLYHKVYYDKGQCYRTVGPQQDYYRQDQTKSSKILPILGVLFVVLLIAGTFFGLGMMTGLLGGRNYLSEAQTKYSEMVKLTQQPQVNGTVTNEIESGQGEVKKPQDKSVIIPPVLPPVLPPSKTNKSSTQVTFLKSGIRTAKTLISIVNQMTQSVKQQKIPIQLPSKIQKASNSTVSVLKNNQSQEAQSQKSIQESIKQVQSQINMTTATKPQKPEAAQIKETQDVNIKPSKTIPMKPGELNQNKTQTNITVIAKQPSTQPFKKSYIKLNEQIKKVKPIAIPTQSPLQQPETQPITKQFDETTIKSALLKMHTNVGLAITKPQQHKIPVLPKPQETKMITAPISQLAQEKSVSLPQQVKPAAESLIIKPKQNNLPSFVSQQPKKPINDGSITSQQAQKMVTIILQENSEVVPQNFKASVKVDILEEFQKVPLNFRDVHHIQTIAYKHLQTLVESDPLHKASFSLINYRHHQFQDRAKA